MKKSVLFTIFLISVMLITTSSLYAQEDDHGDDDHHDDDDWDDCDVEGEDQLCVKTNSYFAKEGSISN